MKVSADIKYIKTCKKEHYYNLFSYLSSNCYSYPLVPAQNKMHLQFYEYSRLQCIKMTKWPLLYIKESWFKSSISAQVYSITYTVEATVY